MPTWAWVSIAVGVWSLLLAIILRGRGMLRGSDAPASSATMPPVSGVRLASCSEALERSERNGAAAMDQSGVAT